MYAAAGETSGHRRGRRQNGLEAGGERQHMSQSRHLFDSERVSFIAQSTSNDESGHRVLTDGDLLVFHGLTRPRATLIRASRRTRERATAMLRNACRLFSAQGVPDGG